MPTRRADLMARLAVDRVYDLVVVGGGATGLGVALAAAARGLSVLLLESHDFAKGTSSRATKLVHGGVRYLAQGNISLVREALHERSTLLRNAPHLIPMIATIGVSIMLTSAAQGLFGAEAMRFPEETLPAGEYIVGDVHVRALEIAIVLISFILMAVMFTILKRTQLGRALRAISESPKAAWLLGIPVERLFHATSFVASALGGIAGVLIALDFNAITPGMGQPMLHKGVAVIILGGMGDIRGALIGGLFLGFAEVISKAYLSSQMGDAVAFGLLFLILLVRPAGLFGRQLERKA